MSNARVRIEHLTKYFGKNLVLEDVSLSVAPHEVVCLIGASGSGKSTLLRCISDLKNQGMTMIVVTHEMSFARDIADRVYFLDNGSICESDAPERLFSNPQNPRTRQFLQRIIEAGRL